VNTATRTSAWALRLPADEARAAAALRLHEGVEVGEYGGELWLRGRKADAPLTAALRALPATARYAWLPDGHLQPDGALLATERLPAAEWQPVRDWLRVALPIAQLPAEAPDRVPLTLRPHQAERTANAALLSLEAWLDWLARAPALRLKPLRFAATTSGQCLVLGTPLPSLPCRPCWEQAGVIVPAGLAWTPAVPAVVVRRVLGVPSETLVLWDEHGVQVLDPELLVPASRGAVRATRQAAKELPL
jgi:hypothetical protein